MIIAKKLILMRHATSSPTIDIEDHNRCLNPKGIDQAAKAAQFLSSYTIDKILVSPALRTRQTMQIITEKMKVDHIEIQEELYKGGKQSITNAIADQTDQIKTLMIIGHNPEIYALIFDIIDDNSSIQNYDKLVQWPMPPAGIIIISFPRAWIWSDINGQRSGKIANIFFDHDQQ